MRVGLIEPDQQRVLSGEKTEDYRPITWFFFKKIIRLPPGVNGKILMNLILKNHTNYVDLMSKFDALFFQYDRIYCHNCRFGLLRKAINWKHEGFSIDFPKKDQINQFELRYGLYNYPHFVFKIGEILPQTSYFI